MTDDKLRQTLAELDCLQGVDETDLAQLAGISRQVEFAAGEVIFRGGDPATLTYLVVEGSVSLEICAPGVGCRRIQTASAGDLLGWSPVLQANRLTATARATTAARVLEIPAEGVRQLCESSPRFGYQFMTRVAMALARRLSAARMQLLDVYGAESAGAGHQEESQ